MNKHWKQINMYIFSHPIITLSHSYTCTHTHYILPVTKATIPWSCTLFFSTLDVFNLISLECSSGLSECLLRGTIPPQEMLFHLTFTRSILKAHVLSSFWHWIQPTPFESPLKASAIQNNHYDCYCESEKLETNEVLCLAQFSLTVLA